MMGGRVGRMRRDPDTHPGTVGVPGCVPDDATAARSAQSYVSSFEAVTAFCGALAFAGAASSATEVALTLTSSSDG
jgi:hypothetical protein